MNLNELVNCKSIQEKAQKLFPGIPDEHKQSFNNLLFIQNLLRLRVLAKCLLVFMTVLIVIQLYFISEVLDPKIITVAPKILILRLFHLAITILFLLLTASPPSPDSIKMRHVLFMYGYLIFNLVYFASLTSLIQSVIHGIALSYVMAILICAIFIYLNLSERLIVFGLSWLSMTILTWLLQNEWIVAFSVFLNCSIISILGIVISSVIYSNKLKDYLNQQTLLYRSHHDELTGLHNRQYIKEIIERCLGDKIKTIGVIMCDVNGLKLINDTMGHGVGDKMLLTTAKAIKESVRRKDVIARIGGDEFLILIPNSSESDVQDIINKVKFNLKNHSVTNSHISLSLSYGYAFCSNKKDIFKTITKADDNMYKEKLYHNQSNRSNIIKTLMKALEARDHITEGHADRLQNLILMVARDLKLSENRLLDVRLLAQFHDIGKVGIADSILFKPGPLTTDEMAEMQRHCEIGYRIALSSPELSSIADCILKHHEWWNGKGYPLGLKGAQIPIECRILAIADAYDAMTNDRPYRKAMSQFSAISELKKFAGVQFDPVLVDKFIEILYKINKLKTESEHVS